MAEPKQPEFLTEVTGHRASSGDSSDTGVLPQKLAGSGTPPPPAHLFLLFSVENNQRALDAN